MKVLAIAVLCSLSLSLAAGRQTSKASSVEDHTKPQELN